MPCAAAAARSSGSWRRARMPPCTFGCSVLRRPSIISGKPVTAETLTTVRPAAASARAVPPVETSSKPRAASPRARSVMPVLSETLSKALGIREEVRYYLPDAGRAWRRKGKAAYRGLFFWSMTHPWRHSKQEENDAYHRQGQVVQQREGLWVHRTRRRE